MKDNDYMYTYSEIMGENEGYPREDWIEYLSPKAIEAYHEYKDSDDQEDY